MKILVEAFVLPALSKQTLMDYYSHDIIEMSQIQIEHWFLRGSETTRNSAAI